MKIKIVLILNIFLYPQLRTQDDMGNKKPIICNIAGRSWRSTYVLNINQLPERCDVFMFGFYVLDRTFPGSYVLKDDKNAFRTLVEANKCVYTRLAFAGTENWAMVFDPSDKNKHQTEIFDPLVSFLIEFKINGLFLMFRDLYSICIDDLATKISCFASALKEKVNKLVVGVMFFGHSYTEFTDNTLFDFSITNKVFDIYVIVMIQLNECNNDTAKTGNNPVTSTDKNKLTIEKVTSGVTSSSMDKSKIYAMIEIMLTIPISLLPVDAERRSTTFSIYCAGTDKTNLSQWCANPSQLIYDQGKYVKKFYAGIVLETLDADDYECKCECGLFPVANLVIDGWTGSPFKDCPALDKN